MKLCYIIILAHSFSSSSPSCVFIITTSLSLSLYPSFFLHLSFSSLPSLPGHQLRSQSLSEMYIQTLLKGCRCLELDCWPTGGGESEDITITHGGTLCTKVTFKVRYIHNMLAGVLLDIGGQNKYFLKRGGQSYIRVHIERLLELQGAEI